MLQEVPQDMWPKIKKLADDSLYFFSKGVLGYNYLTPDFHKPFCNFLQTAPNRRVIVIPRGFLKTTLATVAYTIWRVVHNPELRILLVSASKDNAKKMLRRIRMQFERNPLLQMLYPSVIPDFNHTKWSDVEACVQRKSREGESTFEVAGVGSKIASRHYDIIIEDDLIDPENKRAPSQEEIQRAIEWHGVVDSLLINPAIGMVQSIGTRWAHYDFLRHVLDQKQPAKYIRAAVENGVPTEPHRFPMSVLNSIRENEGSYYFSSQYMNNPVPAEEMTFRPQDMRYFRRLPGGTKKYILVDLAISQKKSADRTAIVCIAVSPDGFYFVDEYTVGRFSATTTVNYILQMARKNEDSLQCIAIEGVAYQKALAQFLTEKMARTNQWYQVKEVRPGNQESKEMRVQSLQPLHQAHRLLIRERGMEELQMEMLEFPLGRHDDIIDACSYITKIAFVPIISREYQEQSTDPALLDNIIADLEPHPILPFAVQLTAMYS